MPKKSDGATPSVERVRRELVERAGGVWDTAAVADHLELSPEEVRKRARRGRLLSYRSQGGDRRYPRAQFSTTGLVEGFESVLDAMHVESPWMRIQLFLDGDVIGSLRDGRVEDAVRAVDGYLPRDPHTG